MRDLMISKAVQKLRSHPEEDRRVGKGALFSAMPTRRGLGGHAKPVIGPAEGRTRWLCLPYTALLLFCLGIGGIGAAHAHAFLDHADPRVGNTVKSPRIVSLWFTQNLESAFSTIEVLNSSGASMNAGRAVVDGSNRKLLRVPVKALPPGSYTVRWRVLSVDTHTTEGNFTFNVGP
jgi:methionine-rich copper-binding protein CopC